MPSLLASSGILPWVDLPYEEELEKKQQLLRQILVRGGLPDALHGVVPSPRPRGARARIKLRRGPKGALGFFRPNSHDFLEVPLDDLARPEVVAAVAAVAGQAKLPLELEFRSDGRRVVVASEEAVPEEHWSWPDVARGNRTIAGEVHIDIAGSRVSPLSFYQVNLEINEAILAEVDATLERLKPARILDVYAGVGNLSGRAVRRGVPATLVESDASSASDARHNLRGLPAEILQADATRLRSGQVFFDTLILDPPRAGAPGLLPKLLVTRPRAILYLSCFPQTLCRDVAPLLSGGYKVTRLVGYDMFPGTEHVETLAVLER